MERKIENNAILYRSVFSDSDLVGLSQGIGTGLFQGVGTGLSQDWGLTKKELEYLQSRIYHISSEIFHDQENKRKKDQTFLIECPGRKRGSNTFVIITRKNGTFRTIDRSTFVSMSSDIPKGSLVVFPREALLKFSYVWPSDSIVLYSGNPRYSDFSSIQNRLLKLQEVTQTLSKHHSEIGLECLWKSGMVLTHIGSGGYGAVYYTRENSVATALKVSALTETSRHRDFLNIYHTSWAELYIHKIVNQIILHKLCPNLLLQYDSFICDDCEEFMNEGYARKVQTSKSCVISSQEYADGDLINFFSDYEISEGEYYSCLFQICAGLCALQDIAQINHRDISDKNIFFFNVTPGGYWKYIIHGVSYYVPNYGHLFVLADYGVADCFSPVFASLNPGGVKGLGTRGGVVIGDYIESFDMIPEKGRSSSSTDIQKWSDGSTSYKAEVSYVSVQPRVEHSHTKVPKWGTNKKEVIEGLKSFILPKNITEYLKEQKIDPNPRNIDFYTNSAIVPPLEFFGDLQDVLRTFRGGIHSLYDHPHDRPISLPRKLFYQLDRYVSRYRDMKSGCPVEAWKVTAGAFIGKFFREEIDYTEKVDVSQIIEIYDMDNIQDFNRYMKENVSMEKLSKNIGLIRNKL